MLFHHLRSAWRTLLNNKTFTAINITGLATGICACMVIYILTSYEFSFDTFHPNSDRIYRIGARIAEHDGYYYGEDVAPPTAEALRREIPGIEAAARYYTWPINDTNAIITDNNYFGIFPYQWLGGNPKTALSFPFSVVLTESQAHKYFGHGPYLGREIIYQDSLHVHVTGIVRDWTGNTDFPYTDLISLSTIGASPFLNRRFHPDSWEIPLLAGRNLRDQDSSHEVIINEAYRNKLGFKTPADVLGHFLTWQDQTWPIVGVIADFHTNSFHDPIYPLLIGKLSHLRRSIALKLSPGSDMAAALTQLQKIWKTQLPGHPFEYHFLDESIARQYAGDIRLSWLVHAATTLTILISCIGLLGLILYVVENRKKEISVRKVLGARVIDILLMINKDFVGLIALALLIASPLAWITLHRWLLGFAYRTSLNWWFFPLAGIASLAITSLTISIRVIRAALINPAAHLRSE
jgi:MacB-like periplasmic core domain